MFKVWFQLFDFVWNFRIGTGSVTVYAEEGIVFLRSQNVYDDGLYLDDVVYITSETDELMRGSRIREGDVLLNITGASLGRTCIVPDGFVRANVNQHVCIIRLKNLELRKFVAMFMKSSRLKGQIDSMQSGAAREGLNFEQISKLSLAIPSESEQAQIVEFLDRETKNLDTLSAEAERAISLLQERRQALISAAVTGKIDVRNFLPSEAA